MAQGVTVEVHGLAELAAGTRILAGMIGRTAGDEFGRTADQLAGQVKGRLPHRTGRLAASVQGRQVGQGAELRMGAGVPYAGYVEYGGRGFPHSSSGNYLGAAAEDAEPQFKAAGEKAARQAIGGMSWPSP